jgi:hypothetical protein
VQKHDKAYLYSREHHCEREAWFTRGFYKHMLGKKAGVGTGERCPFHSCTDGQGENSRPGRIMVIFKQFSTYNYGYV